MQGINDLLQKEKTVKSEEISWQRGRVTISMLGRIQVVSELYQCPICSLGSDTRSNIELNLREYIGSILPH